MTFSIYSLFHFEFDGTGLTFENTDSMYGNYKFSAGLVMLTINFILYLALGIYFDQIIGSSYGVAKPWNFLCTKKFWRS
jgi:hypothetical protein